VKDINECLLGIFIILIYKKMKRYVSLAGAMLLGSVIAQNKETAAPTVTLKLSSGAELKEAEITATL